LMLNRFLSAEEACEWGLVMKVVPHARLMDAAMEVADVIKRMPPLSIRAVKQGVNRGVEGYEFAEQLIENLRKTEDATEGRRAFLEKREPHFRGK
jgi:enoyl-CoA hydratase/carnithine racemase